MAENHFILVLAYIQQTVKCGSNNKTNRNGSNAVELLLFFFLLFPFYSYCCSSGYTKLKANDYIAKTRPRTYSHRGSHIIQPFPVNMLLFLLLQKTAVFAFT